jgi:hypothetical protein
VIGPAMFLLSPAGRFLTGDVMTSTAGRGSATG